MIRSLLLVVYIAIVVSGCALRVQLDTFNSVDARLDAQHESMKRLAAEIYRIKKASEVKEK